MDNDKDQKLGLFLEACGEDTDVSFAQEVLEAHDWDVEAALLAVSQGDVASPQPPAASQAVPGAAAIDSDGYRAPMRTGYTDRLIGPDMDSMGMGMAVEEQAALLAAMSGGQHYGAEHDASALQAMHASRAEYERVADHQEQGYIAQAMQASYAMHMAQEQQRLASYHDADRNEQQQMAQAIEASYREQSLAEERYRADLARATRESEKHSNSPQASSPPGSSSSSRVCAGIPNGSAARPVRPGSGGCAGAQRPPLPQQGQANHRRQVTGHPPMVQQERAQGRFAAAGSPAVDNRPLGPPGCGRSSPDYQRSGSGILRSKECSSASGRPPASASDLGVRPAAKASSSHAPPMAARHSPPPADDAPRRPSKPAVPPTSSLRGGPHPPPANPQAKPTSAGAANAARVASAARGQSAQSLPQNSSSGSASSSGRAPRPGVSMLNSMSAEAATAPRRGASGGLEEAPAAKSPNRSMVASGQPPPVAAAHGVRLNARTEYASGDGASAAVAAASSPPGSRSRRAEEEALKMATIQQTEQQLLDARRREDEMMQKRRQEAALENELRQQQMAAAEAAKRQEAENDRRRQVEEARRQQEAQAEAEAAQRQRRQAEEQRRKQAAELEQQLHDQRQAREAEAARRRQEAEADAERQRQAAASAAAAAASAAEQERQEQEQERRRLEAREAEELRREAEEAARRQEEAARAAQAEEKGKDDVAAALGQLWRMHREQNSQALSSCLTVLRTYIGNLAKNPQDPKFHRINTANQAFKTKVASLEGAAAVLHACGFEEDADGALVVGEAFLKSKGPKLFNALDKLNVMLDQLSRV